MMLGGDSGLDVVAEAGDGEEALRVVPASDADVVLMDIRMPVRDGLSATEELLAADPGLKVIVLTTFDTDDMVLRALRIGAAGFLLKDTPPARLVEAIRTVASGQPMLSPSVTAQLIAAVTRTDRVADEQDRTRSARDALDTLTERERDVADAVARGLSNADIAAELYMGVPTVKTHVGRLFTKLGVENRVQVAILVHDTRPAPAAASRSHVPVPARLARAAAAKATAVTTSPSARAPSALASTTRPRRGSSVKVTSPVRWVHSAVAAMMPMTGSSIASGSVAICSRLSNVASSAGPQRTNAARMKADRRRPSR